MKSLPLSFFLVLITGLVLVAPCNNISPNCWAATPNLSAMRVQTPIPPKILSKEPREVRVFLKTQRFGFYENGFLKFWGPVCTGKKGHETPKGKFRVIKKFNNRLSYKWTRIKGKEVYMPLAIRFVGGCFLHVGEIQQRPSSDGCVRLNEADAARIFRAVKLNDSVIITD